MNFLTLNYSGNYDFFLSNFPTISLALLMEPIPYMPSVYEYTYITLRGSSWEYMKEYNKQRNTLRTEQVNIIWSI